MKTLLFVLLVTVIHRKTPKMSPIYRKQKTVRLQ